jgi:predicted nucleotidyltransferase
MDRLATALFGRGKRAILAQLFAHPDKRFYVREIARAAGAAPSLVQRDLATLTAAGILERTEEGRQVYYRANPGCPIFEELKGIATKTFGIGDALREMLEPFRDRIRVAFVYGSVASGTHAARSDVDVMIVGDLEVSDIAQRLLEAERRLRRPVNPTVYPVAEFRSKAAEGHHFVAGVLERPIVFLIGDQRELERTVRAEPAKTRRQRAAQG